MAHTTPATIGLPKPGQNNYPTKPIVPNPVTFEPANSTTASANAPKPTATSSPQVTVKPPPPLNKDPKFAIGQEYGTGQYAGECGPFAIARAEEFVPASMRPTQSWGGSDNVVKNWIKNTTWKTAGPDDPNPPPGSIAIWDDSVTKNGKVIFSGAGHAAVVESVVPSGSGQPASITFSEQNWQKLKVSESNLNHALYETRGGGSWSNMLTDGSISETDYQAVIASGAQHQYILQGFILPEPAQ
jgi:hypothetical protein